MFLVMLSCSMDDIPVQVVSTREKAVEAAHRLNTVEGIDTVLEQYNDVSGREVTDPTCWVVAEFDENGVLSAMDVVLLRHHSRGNGPTSPTCGLRED